MKWSTLSWLLAVWCLAQPASGAAARFAVIVGNNQGQGGDVRLRFAESDADKVARVLRDLGGFEPADVVVLRGENAATVRSTLITVNDRVRAAQSLPNRDALLFVYYSGHADGEALRLGPSRLDFRELAQLVRGSAAKVRLLVVDACRSGTLTRVKGGRIVAPFDIASSSLRGEGMALLTASAANEDAQESDELRGSFFTHAFVSGLLGAADNNGDGSVVLEEAYGHAYAATLRATSRTFAGTQHPTFQYEVRGQGSLVLTRPGAARMGRAELGLPRGIGFLVLANAPHGPVVGEVGPDDKARAISLRPGRYFVRGRGRDFLLEGTLTVRAGQRHDVDPASLERVDYARLVRKGARDHGVAHGPEVGFAVRSPLPNAATACWGAALGYRWEFESYGLGARLGACTSSTERETITTRTDELSLGLSAAKTWDQRWLSVSAGAGLGAILTHQSFETRGNAPDRLSLSPMGFVLLGASRPVFGPVTLGLDVRGEGHLIRFQPTAIDEPELRAEFAVRGAVVAGSEF